jgi:hypothetical protein
VPEIPSIGCCPNQISHHLAPRDPESPWHGETASTGPRRLLVQAVEKSLRSPAVAVKDYS